MNSNSLLIGSGFYSPPDKFIERRRLFQLWMENTLPVCSNVVVVDNSPEPGAPWDSSVRVIRCRQNLGHPGDSNAIMKPGPLLGWSMSWILPALVAYCDGCDFIYKEQDCFAFGDWVPVVRRGQMTFGRNSQMGCEQSLFYINHAFILRFLFEYLGQFGHDAMISSESKFLSIMEKLNWVEFHDLPGGRDRPLPNAAPYYAQRMTIPEIEERCK